MYSEIDTLNCSNMYSSPQEIWIRIRFLEINRSPSQEPFPDPCFGIFFNECAVCTLSQGIYLYIYNCLKLKLRLYMTIIKKIRKEGHASPLVFAQLALILVK